MLSRQHLHLRPRLPRSRHDPQRVGVPSATAAESEAPAGAPTSASELLAQAKRYSAERNWRGAVSLTEPESLASIDLQHHDRVTLAENVLSACKRASSRDRSAWKGVSKALSLLPHGIPDLNPNGIASALVALGRGHQWSRLDSAWAQAYEADAHSGTLLNASAFCSMITFCDRRRDSGRALQLVRDMMVATGKTLDFGGASVLTKVFGRGIAPLWEEMLDALCSPCSFQLEPLKGLLNALASISREGISNTRLLHRTLRWAEAYGLPYKSDRSCVRCSLAVLRRAGDALGVRERLKEASTAGCDLHVSDFNFALAAARVRRSSADAWEGFNLLEKHGVEPDEATFASLCSACAAEKSPEALQNAIQECERRRSVASDSNGMFRSQLVGTLANNGRVREALNEVWRAHELGCVVGDDAISNVASAAAEFGGARELDSVRRQLRRSGIRLSAESMVLPIARLDQRHEFEAADEFAEEESLTLQHQASRISALGAWNEHTRATRVFENACSPFSHVLHAQASGYVDIDRKGSIRVENPKVDDENEKNDPSAEHEVDNELIAGLLALHEAMIEVHASQALYSEARACVDQIMKLDVQLSQGAGIKVLIAASQIEEIKKLQTGVEEVKEAAVKVQEACGGMHVDAWNVVLWTFAQRGEWFDALRMHEQMDTAGIAQNSNTWAALAYAAEKSGQSKIAADVLADAKASTTTLDEGVYCSCIRAAADAGQWGTVRGLLEEIRSEGLYPGGSAYFALVSKCVHYGQGALVLEALDDALHYCTNVHPKQWELGMHACLQQRDLSRGMKLFDSAKEGKKLTLSMLCFAIELCGLCKETERAQSIFDEAHELGWIVKGRLHASLVRAYAHTGDSKDAVAAYRAEQPSKASCTAVLSALATSGQWETAQQIVQEMGEESRELDDKAYASVVEALWRSGKRQDAIAQMKEYLKAGRFAEVVKHGVHVQPWKKGAKPLPLELGWPRQATHWASSDIHLDVRGLSAGAAQALVTLWLGSISTRTSRGVPVPRALVVFFGKPGNMRSCSDEVRNRVYELLQRIGAPFEAVDGRPGKLHAIGEDVEEWLESKGRELFVRSGAS